MNHKTCFIVAAILGILQELGPPGHAERRRATPAVVEIRADKLEITPVYPQGGTGFLGEITEAVEGAIELRPGADYKIVCSYVYGGTLTADTIAAIPGWKVRFTLDGVSIGELDAQLPMLKSLPPSMGGGALPPVTRLSTMLKWSAPFEASKLGKHVIGCALDPGQSVVESDESNNQLSQAIVLHGPRITGSLLVAPNWEVDPGVTAVTFAVNVTSMSPPSHPWWLDIDVVSPSDFPPFSGGHRKVTGPGHFESFLDKPYKIPCAAAHAHSICFRLRASSAGPHSITADLGTACLPVKQLPGPQEPELLGHHPAAMKTGDRLSFSVKVPRFYCDSSFSISRSPIQSGGWSTPWHEARLGFESLEFPETFEYHGPGTGLPQDGSRRPVSPLCFVLEMHAPSPRVVDKWCVDPPATLAEGGAPSMAPPRSSAPRPESPHREGSHGSGETISRMRPTTATRVNPLAGAAVQGPARVRSLKADLVVDYQPGGGWYHVPPVLVVRNLGQSDTGPCQLRLAKAGAASTVVAVHPVAARSSTEIDITQEMWLYVGGTVTVDALNQVDEVNESNNVLVWVVPGK